MPRSKIALVGTGMVGRAWAVSYARAGCDVAMFDPVDGVAEAACALIPPMLADLAAADLLDGQTSQSVLSRIAPVDDMSAALVGAVHVQENAPEDLAIKRALWEELDAVAAPETVLASSTSAILPSAFSETLVHRERCLVAHPINPPYLVPAVEVVPAPWTSSEAIERTATLMREIGQRPIVMRREIDGFIMNRMQGALLQEAFRLVEDGYATAEDVDVGIRDGLGLRWAFMGPFETIDLNAPGGVTDYVDRYQDIYVRLWPSQARRVDWGPELANKIAAERSTDLPRDQLQTRQNWRDRELMALIAHKRRRAEGG